MLAHITKTVDGGVKKQSLKEHCSNTAVYAKKAVYGTGFETCAYLVGLLHDMGKAKKEFQNYLISSFYDQDVVRGSVNHTFAGVIYLLEKYHDTEKLKKNEIKREEYLSSEILAFVIGSHHGMFDCCDLEGKNGFIHRLEKDRKEIFYEESYKNYFSEVIAEEKMDKLFLDASEEIAVFGEALKMKYENENKKIFYGFSMLCRMLLSALIYGDRKDTMEFMSQTEIPFADSSVWEKEFSYFENEIRHLIKYNTLNQVRADISDQCLEFAEQESGIYRLNVPTGGGKTLCSLRYALKHAKKYQKKHIIFVIPLLSILDQNAAVIRKYLSSEDILLEHHSNVLNEKEAKESLDRYELFTTTYDSPVIITTMVQFLNILFSHKTSAIGRMQAFSNSVIVIDEIQSLPKKVLYMFNMAMNFLSEFCNTTIVLSSATQPCLETVEWDIHYSKRMDMVRLSEEQRKVFHRADIINEVTTYGMDIEECAAFCLGRMEEHSALLVICNTKGEALQLYQEIVKKKGICVYHLSTSMCKAHRKDILDDLMGKLSILQENLRKGLPVQKIICVSTQLVEAGIDFSFDGVVRIMAGIDNLAQAAGRCNRSGEYEQLGKVYLVNLKKEDLSKLREIQYAKDSTWSVLYDKEVDLSDLTGDEATKKFYRKLLSDTKNMLGYPVAIDRKNYYLTDFLANKNPFADGKKAYLLLQPFLTVGKAFEVFDDATIDLIVPYKEGKQKIEELEIILGQSFFDMQKVRLILKDLKEYTIGIYQYQKEKLDEYGLIIPILEGRSFILKEEAYSLIFGLNIPKEYSVENFIL